MLLSPTERQLGAMVSLRGAVEMRFVIEWIQACFEEARDQLVDGDMNEKTQQEAKTLKEIINQFEAAADDLRAIHRTRQTETEQRNTLAGIT